jgi:hypothetical protein
MSTTTVYHNSDPIDQMFNNIRDIVASQYQRPDYSIFFEEKNNSFAYKLGKFSRKSVSYFKRPETKTAVLIATWVVESVAYAFTFLVLLASGAYITAALWTAMYTYISYAFFAMLRDATIANALFLRK